MNAHGSPAAGAAGAEEPKAERRQITVLFCDLVDSTALSSRLDPEDLDDAMRQLRAVLLPVIEHHGGLVVRYMGDDQPHAACQLADHCSPHMRGSANSMLLPAGSRM